MEGGMLGYLPGPFLCYLFLHLFASLGCRCQVLPWGREFRYGLTAYRCLEEVAISFVIPFMLILPLRIKKGGSRYGEPPAFE